MIKANTISYVCERFDCLCFVIMVFAWPSFRGEPPPSFAKRVS
jgi:hypothetical protein